MSRHNTYCRLTPVCPRCGHEFTVDDMLQNASDTDLFALAPNEGTAEETCAGCQLKFWIKGSYTPEYSTAIEEDQL